MVPVHCLAALNVCRDAEAATRLLSFVCHPCLPAFVPSPPTACIQLKEATPRDLLALDINSCILPLATYRASFVFACTCSAPCGRGPKIVSPAPSAPAPRSIRLLPCAFSLLGASALQARAGCAERSAILKNKGRESGGKGSPDACGPS